MMKTKNINPANPKNPRNDPFSQIMADQKKTLSEPVLPTVKKTFYEI